MQTNGDKLEKGVAHIHFNHIVAGRAALALRTCRGLHKAGEMRTSDGRTAHTTNTKHTIGEKRRQSALQHGQQNETKKKKTKKYKTRK